MLSTFAKRLGVTSIIAITSALLSSAGQSPTTTVAPLLAPTSTKSVEVVPITSQPTVEKAIVTTKPALQKTVVTTTTITTTSVTTTISTATTSAATKQATTTTPVAPNGTYTNTSGNVVPSPYYAPTAPAGASARCRDGTYSFSQNRRGTCSRHGGVAEWL